MTFLFFVKHEVSLLSSSDVLTISGGDLSTLVVLAAGHIHDGGSNRKTKASKATERSPARESGERGAKYSQRPVRKGSGVFSGKLSPIAVLS